MEVFGGERRERFCVTALGDFTIWSFLGREEGGGFLSRGREKFTFVRERGGFKFCTGGFWKRYFFEGESTVMFGVWGGKIFGAKPVSPRALAAIREHYL